MDKDTGNFNVLDLWKDEVFKTFEEYLDSGAVASVMFTVNAWLLENDAPKIRFFDTHKHVNPVDFEQGPMSKYDNMYGFLRTAMMT